MVKTAKVILALLGLVFASPCLAGENSPVDPPIEQDALSSSAPPAQPSHLDVTRRAVSSRICTIARWVDAFFSDPNYTVEEADGRLELRQQAAISKDSLADFGTSISGRLSLPNMSRRWNLIFEGSDDLVTADTTEETADETAETSGDSSSVAVQYFHNVNHKLNSSVSVGARLDTPSVYIGPRFRLQTDLSEHWLGRFTQRIRWDTNDGWESITKVDFDRQLWGCNLFRQSFSAEWRENRQDSEEVQYTITSALTQPLAENTAIRYSWSSAYFTQPTAEWSSSVVTVSYRQRIWRDWAFLEIGPFISWEDELDWEVNPGVHIALDIIFEE